MAQPIQHFSRFTDYDTYLFKSGKHFRLFEKLGSHLETVDGQDGVFFAVWAPNALSVSVIGDFNYWNTQEHPLFPRWDGTGIWEGFIPGVTEGTIYKYSIETIHGERIEKGDPFAFLWENPPKTASIVRGLDYVWRDKSWMDKRSEINGLNKPISVYEVHLGSWRRNVEEDNRSLTYAELAIELVQYVKEMGFTHIELMPVMEHPFFGSWGYQITGFFAPSSRFGNPQEFMALVDACHQAGIGIILDWVPSHFPSDGHGLFRFDGTALYEHEDPRKGFHPDWNSYIFNYGRFEVRSFLISNALFWLEKYHVDGLRVDAVASMLYLDYSRKEGEWIPNHHGGRENLEAIAFLRELNETIYREFPDVQCIAEESTAWPGVSRPTFAGGLGFGMKWMMGWMHDTLDYFKIDPFYRKFHHHQLTFSIVYAFTENFMLPLSHDEVVHGKGSLLGRMPGDEWQKMANLRTLYTYMYTHPGTKLLFMGGEIGQFQEWNHDSSLHWHLLDQPLHAGLNQLMKELNSLYRTEKSLFERSFDGPGFEWIELNDQENCTLVYKRIGSDDSEHLIIALNLTPVPRSDYRIGIDDHIAYVEVFNSDATRFGGSGMINGEKLKIEDAGWHMRNKSLVLTLPPLGAVVIKGVSTLPKLEVVDTSESHNDAETSNTEAGSSKGLDKPKSGTKKSKAAQTLSDGLDKPKSGTKNSKTASSDADGLDKPKSGTKNSKTADSSSEGLDKPKSGTKNSKTTASTSKGLDKPKSGTKN